MNSWNVVKSELNYLVGKDLGFGNPYDAVVSLRVSVNQAMQAYTTAGVEHGKHMVRHIGGLAQYYFVANQFAQKTRPFPPTGSFGKYLILLDRMVRQCEDAVHREAVGDIKSHFMTVLSLVHGCILEFDIPERQGYGIEDGVEDEVENGPTR